MKLQMKLTTKSIQDVIDELEKYKSSLDDKCNEIARQLAIRGAEMARAQIIDVDAVFSGELLNSIKVDKGSDGVFFIVADSEHAAFVEFGTGYKGEDKPYPYKLPQGVTWNYKVGRQLLANAEKGIYGWFYYKNGGWWFTEGMPSRPFMHNTAILLESEIYNIVKGVMRNG